MKKAREYRKEAREHLQGDIFGSKFLYAVLVILVVGALEAILTATGVGAIVAVIFLGPITFGTITIFQRVIRKEDEHADLNHLFDGFKEKFGQSVITSLLEFVYTLLWSLLFIIPGIVKSYSYAASMYLVRAGKCEGNDAITESRKLMKGHKWKLFCLDLSFIGWYLLGVICLGVGVLWAEAYHQVAQVEFFEDLLKEPVVVEEVK